MGSFRRAFLGYRRAEVDAAIGFRNARIGELQVELATLSEMVVGRERELDAARDGLDEANERLELSLTALREANERHERSLGALETVAMKFEEIHAQARGQATRIRMKALQDAVRISQGAQEIADRIAPQPAAPHGSRNGVDPTAEDGGPRSASELFEGMVEVEIGPLGDFSQLVGFEDAAGRIGATSEISVRKFSEGRATLSMRLDEPVELLRELEERSPMEFRVRRNEGDRVVLDLDDDEAAAA